MLDNKTFIEKIAEQYDDSDRSCFNLDTHFRDSEGWSSLTALSIIAMIDEVYKVRLNGDDIRNSITINDLFKIVKSRM
ncbi:MAG: acyl carrier protein [Bacteroidales bacterium]|nr:acyl carrier protein [Bacteroidales bacterium]